MILQGGHGFEPNVKTIATARGPTLCRGVKSEFGNRIEYDPASPEVQVGIRLRAAIEPIALSEDEVVDLYSHDENAYLAYESAMSVSKVGGNPLWVQNPQTPPGGPWRLLAQVDVEHVPCWVPFDGCLYAFVAADGRRARMLYQMT